MATLPQDMSVAIDELETAIAAVESRLESARAERDEAQGRQVELEIENANLRRELVQVHQRQNATADVLKVIARSTSDFQPVLDAIIDSAASLFGRKAALRLVEPDGLRRRARSYEPDTGEFHGAEVLPIDRDSLVGCVVLDGRAMQDADTHASDASPYVREHADELAFRSIASAPLMRNGTAIGVISVSSPNPGALSEQQMALLSTFADQAVIAIENARLFNETKEALEQQKASSDILRVISSSVADAHPVFDKILASCKHLFGSDETAVLLLDGEDTIRLGAYVGNQYDAVADTFPAPLEKSPAGRAIREQHVVHYTDVANDPRLTRAVRRVAELAGYQSMAYAPMLSNGRGIGAIGASRSKGTFSDKELTLLQSFADQAVIAIENARLFRDTQEALEQQRASADVLRVISQSVADTAPVFRAIGQSCQRLFGSDQVVISLVRGDGMVYHAATVTSPDVRPAHAERLFLLMDESFPRPLETAYQAYPIHQKRVVHYPDFIDGPNVPETMREFGRKVGNVSMLIAPMLWEGRGIGTIHLIRQPPRPFSAKEHALLATFADQASIAIENARLFRETKEALERQTATADILKVIASSPSDVQPVFDAIAASSKRLLGGFSTTVFRLLDGVLHLVAFTPTTAPADTALTAMFPRPIADFPPFAMIGDGRMSRIEDTESDAGVPPMLRDIARLRGYRAMLLTPLMREGTVLGMISVTREKPGAWAAHHADLLRTFADQAVIAIENARLFNEVTARTEELSESLQQQTAVGDVLKTISRSTFDLQPVLDTLVNTAALLCNADMAFIMRREGDEYRAGAAVGYAEAYIEFLTNHPLAVDRGTVTGRAVIERRPVQILDVVADPEYTLRETTSLAGQRTTLGVPLLREDEPVGVIVLARQRVEAFTQKQIDLVTTFADQAVIAIENVRLFDELRGRTDDLGEALQQQTATADVLKVISRSAFDLKAVLDALLTSACHLCNADIGTIRYRDDGDFRLAATFGCPPEWIDKFSTYSTKADRGTVFGRTIIDGHTIHIPDVLADPDFKRFEAQKLMGFRAALGVPLTREGQVFGVINLFRFTVSSFENRQIELVQTFADQAVIAIENVRLFNEVKARTEELSEALQQQTATADVLKLISRSAFDLQAVLNTLTESAVRLCNADMGAIALQDERGFYHATNYNFTIDWIKITDGLRLQPGKDSLIGRTLLASAPVQIADVLADPDYNFPDMQQAAGYRSLLGVPLMRGGEPIGVLFLGRKIVEPYSNKQVELVSTFADQAVIAIENVRLFDEVQAKTRDLQEALTYQTGSANILRVIASSPTDVGPVLKAIVESACELCGAYDSIALLKEGDHLRFSAHHGPIPLNVETWPINRQWVSGRAFVDQKPVHVTDLMAEDDEFPDGRDLSMRMGHRSMVAVPLLREGESIGALILRRNEVNPFSEKQIALLQTFADQAVIAIGNVHLFEEVQARTRDLTESLQQQTATSEVLEVISASAGELEPVFQKMLANAILVCGAEFGSMNLTENGAMRPVAQYNVPAEYAAARGNRVFTPHPTSPLASAIRTKQVVHWADLRTTESYLERSRAAVELVELGGARTVAIVPMLRDDEVIGAITIFRKEVKLFSDKQIELLNNFAKQAVIAIENARLLKELRQRTEDLSKSLDDLRTAQNRLVQTEKLASLGQLTAGIAHEIKNPLNFVNNFAALSAELTEELNDILQPAGLGDKMREEVNELTGLLKGNLEKVVQHGKRADSIVKNMLLHSREGGGEHRLSDINALVEESLNLAYHGARAEKPGFNVTLERDFDPAAGQLDLYPQEVTRVILNLVSNGFHAVTSRGKQDDAHGFEPTLRASTRNLGDAVEIRIRDNGTGIPPEVREKMFDPFFTTKPAGEGTGLGLSMSHDIVVKQHGGTIEVDTEHGRFTEFRIVLPRTGNFTEKSGGSP